MNDYNKKNDAPYITKDFLQGEDSLYNTLSSLDLSYQDIMQAISSIVEKEGMGDSKKIELLDNLWKVNFEIKPPSMEEFLTPQFIGPVADKLFDHVKKTLIEFMNPDPNNKKRVLALSTHIGWGKSSASVLLVLFIIVNLSYMRSPKRFFNLNEMGSLVAVMLSFTLKKANQLLLQPFFQTLKASPIFHATRKEDGLPRKQNEIPKGHIAYTTAGRMGSLQFEKDIHIVTLSDRASLLGMNVFAGIASEISFWIQKGVGIEEIWGSFQDLRNRINNRFAHSYMTATILDSSPIDMDLSPIDKWLYSGEALEDPEVMFINAKTWESFPEKFPIWNKTGETFPVFRGSSSKPPKLIEREEELKDYDPEDIYNVPIDDKLAFQQNLRKKIADDCAFPSGGLLKLFENVTYIDNIFSPILKNVTHPIEIPEERDPTHLIWDQVKDIFFINIDGNYSFYRSPKEKRTIHIDLSETGDISGIAMSHKELNIKGEQIIIHDFLIPLHKGKSRINIDAVCDFVLDLYRIGKIDIYKVTADRYQSSAILQRMRREGFNASNQSVDKETAPYMLYSSWVKSGRVKAGKSIHLKNNLRSLVEMKRDSGSIKVDHIQGDPIYEDGLPFEKSMVGYRAKDISDVACGSAYPLITELEDLPIYTFDDRVDQNGKEQSLEKILEKIYKSKLLTKSSIQKEKEERLSNISN